MPDSEAHSDRPARKGTGTDQLLQLSIRVDPETHHIVSYIAETFEAPLAVVIVDLLKEQARITAGSDEFKDMRRAFDAREEAKKRKLAEMPTHNPPPSQSPVAKAQQRLREKRWTAK